jgi:hypothetical protein
MNISFGYDWSQFEVGFGISKTTSYADYNYLVSIDLGPAWIFIRFCKKSGVPKEKS